MAATRMLSCPSLIFPSHDICETKIRHVCRVIGYREHSAAAHFHFRSRQFELVPQSRQQFVHQPAWNLFSLGGIYETEVQQVYQQDFPVLLHRTEQSLPVDFLILHQYEMGDISAVIAFAILNENL